MNVVRKVRRKLDGDGGMTLVELTVAGLISSILLLGAFSALDVGTRAERGQQARHDAMLEVRGAMDRFTKELRQATWINPGSTHQMLEMNTLIAGVDKRVKYELVATGGDLYDLRRTVSSVPTPSTASVATPGPTQTLVSHMVVGTTPFGSPDPPFCYSYYSAGNPSECIDGGAVPPVLTAVRVTLAKDPEFNPAEPITLATDVKLRNI
jgi:type II secretory pathway pseudopilin PulG